MSWNKNITNPKDAKKELKRNGFEFVRQTGDHQIFSDGIHIISLVNNPKRFSKYTWADSIKKAYMI